MSMLGDARRDLAAKITAAGWRAVTDVRDVNPPCVLVGAPAQLTRRTACSVAGIVEVLVLAAPPGNDDALELLLTVLEDLAGVVGWVTAEPSTFNPTPASSTGDLPAYALTVPIHT